MQRAEVTYYGHVQGVGFRFTAQRIARRWPIAGFVQNCEDGSVLLIAEGPRKSIDEFLEAVASEMAHNIREQHIRWEPATNEFANFGIRR